MCEKQITYRKTFPVNLDNRGPVSRPPEIPRVKFTDLAGIRICVVSNEPMTSFSGYDIWRGVVRERVAWARGEGKIHFFPKQRGYLLTPVSEQPLIPVFTVPHGGGRVYGGGTSPEALRRAKRKTRLHGLNGLK